jgi:ribonuclease P protein component
MLASLLLHPRVGIIVPKHRHSGVERNKLKRRLREIVRQDILPAISVPADLVVRATPRAYEASYATLRTSVTRDIVRIMSQYARS